MIPELIDNIYNRIPTFGDHRLVVLSLFIEITIIRLAMRRDWRGYSTKCKTIFMSIGV
jgi:hypothetical protein